MSALRLELWLERSALVAGEQVRPVLVVENAGAAPVRVPDPLDPEGRAWLFTLEREGAPARRFTLGGDDLPEGGEGLSVEVLPGARREDAIPLSRLLPLEGTGRHSLTMALRLPGGARLETPPLRFEVLPLEATAGAAGLDMGVPGLRRAEAIALHGGGALLRASFREDDPGQGTLRPPLVRKAGATAPGASDALLPLSGEDRSAGAHDWTLWREGPTLRARHASRPEEEAALSLALDGPPEAVLRPALMAASGEVDVYVVSEGGGEVAVARFFPPPLADDDDPAIEEPAVIDAIPLDGPLAGFGALIGPEGAESPRHLLFLLEGEEGALSVQRWLLSYGYEASLEDEAPLPRDLVAIPGTRAAMRLEEDGALEAALLCARDPEGGPSTPRPQGATLRVGRDRLALVRLRWPSGEESGPPEVLDLGPLPAPARAAAAAFSIVPGSEDRLDWVLLLADGRALDSRDPLHPARPDAPLAVPLEIVPLAYRGYVLALDPERGPRLLPLGGEGAAHASAPGCCARHA